MKGMKIMERARTRTWLTFLLVAVLAVLFVYIIKSYENIIAITDATLV